MVQLPTRDVLGPLPSARSGRIIANYDTSAAGRGLASLGEQIAGAADTIGRVGASVGSTGGIGGVSQAEKFETNRRFLEFVSSQQQAYEDGKQSVEPGAFGFREQAQKNYLDSAKEFFGTIPDALKPEYDMKLFAVEDDFLNKSRAYETAERTRYYGEEVNKGLTTIESDLFKNPENFDRNFAAGAEHINAIPDEHLSRIQKADLVKQWRAKAQLASLNGVSPQERIRLLGGAPNPVETQPTASRGQAVTRGISGDIRKIVSDAAVQYGVDPDAMLTIAWIESRGNPNAKNPNSSAGGLFQFIDSTARGYGLTNKFDPVQAADAAARLARDNSIALERVLGRKPTAGELYLAHQQGIGGATKLLSNPNARAVDLVGGEAVRLNGGKSDMTAGEFAMLWMKKAGDTHIPDGGFMSAQYDASKADPRFADMNYEVAQKIIQGSQAEIDASFTIAERAQAEQAAAAKVQYDQHKGSLELAIETGELNSELAILNDEVLSDAHIADLLASYKAKNKDRIQAADALNDFKEGALRVDPYDSEGRKTVDNMFKEVAKTAPPEQMQATTEEIVRQTGVVPQQALNAIRGGLTSQRPEEVAAAAQSAQRLSTVDPAALGRRDGGKEVQEFADDFSHYVNNLNMSPEDAARKIMDARDPAKKIQRKAMEPAAKEFLKGLESVNIADAFDTVFGAQPEVGFSPAQALGIQAEFAAIAEDQFYKSNGDPEIAKNRAIEEMKRLYGVTELTGKKVLMKHPPERYWPQFPVSEAAQSLSYPVQLENDLREFSPNLDMSSVQLVTTPETDAMVKRGEMPGYAVIYKDENGVLQTIPGKLWRPDVSKLQEMQDSVDRAERAARENAARAERKQQRQQAPYRVQKPEDFLSGNDPVFGERGESTGPTLPDVVETEPSDDDIGSEIMVIP